MHIGMGKYGEIFLIEKIPDLVFGIFWEMSKESMFSVAVGLACTKLKAKFPFFITSLARLNLNRQQTYCQED